MIMFILVTPVKSIVMTQLLTRYCSVLPFCHNVMHGLMLWSVNNSRKRRPLTVTLQCTACSENSVKPSDWHLVVLGGIWWNTWWCLVTLGGTLWCSNVQFEQS